MPFQPRERHPPSRGSSAQEPAEVGGLAGVLDVVVGDADHPHAEGDRRIPTVVDDLVEVVGTEPGEALDGAIELAERITANGPLAVATTKEILVKSADWSEDEMWKKQLEYIIPIFSSNDAKEGAIAFAEKRAPKWTGT